MVEADEEGVEVGVGGEDLAGRVADGGEEEDGSPCVCVGPEVAEEGVDGADLITEFLEVVEEEAGAVGEVVGRRSLFWGRGRTARDALGGATR